MGAGPPRRPRTWDVALSVVAVVGGAVVVATGVLVGVVSLAFLDACAPPACSAGAAWAAVVPVLVVAAAVDIAGMAITVLRLTRRRRAWPFAVGALVVTVAVLAVGAVGYTAAVR